MIEEGGQHSVLVLDRFGSGLEIEQKILTPVGATVSLASDDPATLDRQLDGADGLLTEFTRVDADLLRRAPRCRAVITYTTGFDQVDLTEARERGVMVANIPGHCTEEVADHAMALILSLCRRIMQADAIVRSGGWGTDGIGVLHRLRGRTLGVVGFGRIGCAVADRGRAFGLRVLAFDPLIRAEHRLDAEVVFVDDLETLLHEADIVSLHVPLSPETDRMIGHQAFEAMRPGAVLVNTSRGRLIDIPSLLEALDTGRLAGAGLDVFPTHPPEIGGLDRSDVILTPHMAYYSMEAMEDARTFAAQAMAAALSGGEPANRLV